jgi:hypothetical protein
MAENVGSCSNPAEGALGADLGMAVGNWEDNLLSPEGRLGVN